jgi:hypothetical protein
MMRTEGFDLPRRKTQLAALNRRHLFDQLPCLESLLMQHLKSTVSEGLGRQLDFPPPSVHAATCKNHLVVLPSGGRHLKLDLSSEATLHAGAAVLPQMQGLESLELTVNLLSMRDFQGVSFLSCITGLKAIRLNVKNDSLIVFDIPSVTDYVVAHLRGLTTLHCLDLSCCSCVSDFGVAYLKGLTALQHLDLNGCHGVTDCSVIHLMSLTALKHLDLSWCNRVTDKRRRPAEYPHRAEAPRP